MVCRAGHENDPVERMRHSAAHVMADAVQQLFPDAKVTIGPVIEQGFYYDFDYPRGFTPDDLARIEERMRAIIAKDLPFTREEVSKADAHRLFAGKDERYKLEILAGIPDERVSLYRHGAFVDLCKGPHVERTGAIRAFKLLKVAGAYWRGSEKNPMLQRIYGTAFATPEDLQRYLDRLAEAERRDHRRLGQELDLFSTLDQYGPGLILWHPKGARVRRIMEDYWRQAHDAGGYDLVFTPHIARLDLWKVSGHWDFYRDNMYAPMEVDGVPYELKPMNCPFHIQIYSRRIRSYRDLPLRYAELGTVYRYERSGVMHGLMRVRGFTQDDAHIFCTPEQLEGEIAKVLDFVMSILSAFGFSAYEVYLSTKPERHVGTDAQWDLATRALRNALQQSHVAFTEDPGEGVFYGPKIDIKIKDVLDRAWQCSTIQVDFNLPQRYGIEFVGADGARHQPIMVHRALLGSLERFFGVLIEHYAGAFPVWLAPVQAVVIPVADTQLAYAEGVLARLRGAGVRGEGDWRNEKLGAKIREAQREKIPYMLVIGQKETAAGTVAVRHRSEGDLGPMTIEAFLARWQSEASAPPIESKTL
ncbi:MAG: threonine--tRNA ligase [Deltaproteobacteria bacterium]|nr:threonine--tRNA ligase [Deltaproteobacteria bacterium]